MSRDDDDEVTEPSDHDEQREARRREFSRREILRAGMAAPAILSLPALLAACGSDHSDSAQRTSANHQDHTDTSGHSDHSDTGQHTDHADKAHSDHGDAAQHNDHADNAHTDGGHVDHADAPHTDHVDGGHVDKVHIDKGQHFDFGPVHVDGVAPPHNDVHFDVPHFDLPQHNDFHFDSGSPPTQRP